MTKAEVVEAAELDPDSIRIQSTSIFNEYDGPAVHMPIEAPMSFVGPDPWADRRFYGGIVRHADGTLVVL
jgi:hypothetical protein